MLETSQSQENVISEPLTLARIEAIIPPAKASSSRSMPTWRI
jgi:hypothetical protein